jgi:uncharacterized protein YabN with tetrapyrrole methylase and pyrophosphatase domain
METPILKGIINDFTEENEKNALTPQGIVTLKEFEAIQSEISTYHENKIKTLTWASDKGLLMQDNLHNILDKLSEEIQELSDSILLEGNFDHAEDEAGDVMFVLTQVAELIGTNLNKAHKRAVKKVLARKVVVIDGKAIKESDL